MKKRCKTTVSCLLFLFLLGGCGRLLRYMVTDDTASYTRIMLHEMYGQDNIDILFAGSSHCYRSFIPDILDEELHADTFNAGTSSQALDGSFMMIKEAARYHDLKHVYLEVYFNVGLGEPYKQRSQLTQTYIISDYLRPSFDKYCYLFQASSKEHYINSFIVARRNWEKLLEPFYVFNLLSLKHSDSYKNYEYDFVTAESEYYAGKGFVASRERVDNWNYFQEGVIDELDFENLSQDWKNSLNEIIDFCNNRGIGITLVSAPMSSYYIASLGNYDEYADIIHEITKEKDTEYLDFNLCREEFIPNCSEIFKDADHLNEEGAAAFSRIFARYVNGDMKADKLFYKTFHEKMSSLPAAVFGIVYQDQEDGTRICKAVSNSNQLQYRIELFSLEGKLISVQNWSENALFTMPSDSHGICIVNYRHRSDRKEYSVPITY